MDRSAGQSPANSQTAASVQWRVFLRALAEEVDSLAVAGERDDMLRGVGRRMGRLMPLPAVDSLPALEMEMNDALEAVGWGAVRLELNEAERALHVMHSGLPRIGSLGAPSGQWLAALLEGLYDTWFAQQPGSKTSLSTRRVPGDGNAVVMRYARA
jgi:hypothetical protein